MQGRAGRLQETIEESPIPKRESHPPAAATANTECDPHGEGISSPSSADDRSSEEGEFQEVRYRKRKKQKEGQARPSPSLATPESQQKRNSTGPPRARAGKSNNPLTTVLFKPTAQGESLRRLSRFDLGEELRHLRGLRAIRINPRLNIVAIDTTSAASCTALLRLRSLGGVPVVSCLATEEGRTRAVLRNIDTTGEASDLIARIATTVPITGGIRKGKFLFLTFMGRQPPKYVTLSHIRVPVEVLTSRNLQCGNCCRYGHVRAVCGGDTRCARCAGGHAARDCTASGLKCCNCGEAHWATAPSCPARSATAEPAPVKALAQPSPPRRPAAPGEPASPPEQPRASYASALLASAPSAALLGEAMQTIQNLASYIERMENGERR